MLWLSNPVIHSRILGIGMGSTERSSAHPVAHERHRR